MMAAIKSKPRSTRNRSSGHSPGPNATVTTAEADDAGAARGQDASDGRPSAVAEQAAAKKPHHRDARTQDTVLPTDVKESGTPGSSSTARPEHTREEAQRVQHGSQGSTPSSDSEEVVIIESEQAKDSKPKSMADSQSKETMASGPHSQASASSGHSHGVGPGANRWTREDTQLSKAMSQLLRHKSKLKLDQAGYAKLSDMLVHPRLRNLNPTLEWMMHIVRLNAKQRFALNEAGTHIRAKQGHSIKVDPSKLLRKLGTGDIGDMIPACALHSTYFSNVPSIMQIGLLPGGTRGAKYRQHIHLAISHRPDAGLREGSDLILMVDLMKAQNAGCVFYISDNNVVLTADCIPPSCIVRATCTGAGAAFDLNQYRAKYMWGYTASAKFFHVRTVLQFMLTLYATSTHLLLSTCCRCFLQSTFAQPGALFSRPTCCNEPNFSGQSTLTRHTGLVRRPSCQVGQSPHLRSKEQAFKTALPTGTGFGSLINEQTWGAWSVMPHCRYKSRASVSLRNPRQTALLSLLPAIPGLKTTMQRGTPIGKERHYTWRANARRSEESSPSRTTSTDRSTGGGTGTGPTAGNQECSVGRSTKQRTQQETETLLSSSPDNS